MEKKLPFFVFCGDLAQLFCSVLTLHKNSSPHIFCGCIEKETMDEEDIMPIFTVDPSLKPLKVLNIKIDEKNKVLGLNAAVEFLEKQFPSFGAKIANPPRIRKPAGKEKKGKDDDGDAVADEPEKKNKNPTGVNTHAKHKGKSSSTLFISLT
jgi:hypothetical protein